MKNTEQRLIDEASGLDALRVTNEREKAFRQQLAHTRQQRDEQPDKANGHRGWWLSGLVAASIAIAFVAVQPTIDPAPQPATISATPTPVAVDVLQPALPALRDIARLEKVSHATALEEEWVNIRKDLEQARERIESDLPVRF